MLRKLSEGEKRTIAHWVMEFVVVVMGVLIALWLQERAAQAGHKADARASEAAIRDEIDENLMGLVISEAVDVCLRDRLREIDQALQTPGRVKPILTPTIWDSPAEDFVSEQQQYAIYSTIAGDMVDSAWRSANASGAVSAFDPERFRTMANLYSDFGFREKMRDADREAIAKLQILAYDVPLTPDTRARLIESLTILSRNWAFVHSPTTDARPQAVAGVIMELGWNDKERIDRRIRAIEASVKAAKLNIKPCVRPLKNPFDD